MNAQARCCLHWLHDIILTIASLILFVFNSSPCKATGINMSVTCKGDVTIALKDAISSAFANKTSIQLVANTTGDTCMLSSSLLILRDMKFTGIGKPTLKLLKTGSAFIGNQESENFSISNLIIDGSEASKASVIKLVGVFKGQIENVSVLSPGDGIAILSGSHDISIEHVNIIGSRLHGITILDSYNNSLVDVVLNGQAGFGVILAGTSNGNKLDRLSTKLSGLELVGMTLHTYNNALSDSNASRTGDNCYSITGSHNKMRNLSGDHCAGSGIAFYGSHNSLDGGNFRDNGQKFTVRAAWGAALIFNQGFGGVAQHNLARNVIIDDDQSPPTQQVGVMTSSFGYKQWARDSRVVAGDYRYSGLTLYQARTSGSTGPNSPARIGNSNDGNVVWDFVNDFEDTVLPDFNRAENVSIKRVGRLQREDLTPSLHNQGTR